MEHCEIGNASWSYCGIALEALVERSPISLDVPFGSRYMMGKRYARSKSKTGYKGSLSLAVSTLILLYGS